MKTKLPFVLIPSLLLTGCVTQNYTHESNGIKTTASSSYPFFVKRDVGRVSVDNKGITIEGAKTDTSAVAQAFAQAIEARIR